MKSSLPITYDIVKGGHLQKSKTISDVNCQMYVTISRNFQKIPFNLTCKFVMAMGMLQCVCFGSCFKLVC